MKWVLRVEYRRKNEKGEYEYYKVDLDYNGCTDKFNFKWVMDSQKLADNNCKPGEDIMGYELVQVEVV